MDKKQMLSDGDVLYLYHKWEDTPGASYADLIRSVEAKIIADYIDGPRPLLVTRTSENSVMLGFRSCHEASVYERASVLRARPLIKARGQS